MISRAEFMDFTAFVMVVSFLESEAGSECRRILDGEKKTEDLLKQLRAGKANLFEVVPYLPDWLVDLVMSEEFVSSCLSRFTELDADKNDTLDATELYPVVLELSEAHPFSVELTHCQQMLEIFDEDKNGVISREEFVDFARFVMVNCYLKSDEGRGLLGAVEEVKAIEAGEEQIEALLGALKNGKAGVQKTFPFLPLWLVEGLCNEQFAASCQEKFEALDVDQSGYLDPTELYPVVMKMSEAHPFSVSLEHCTRLLKMFDADGNGVISRGEFADFAMFVMISCYLDTEEGKMLARQVDSPVVQRLQENAEEQQAAVQRLQEENEELRLKTQNLEQMLRAVEEKVNRLAQQS